ncbi:uncharacterized protein LOC123316669 [Coccinella septempunctata]|uniref:uncharacterized protein LOC123316669 n=1 Tax=Coccinella septempunctata TaxID=41139 RepID=UPI001D091A7C|nr:uncharacterized protein LOC123316669 [Coccinella septempunctata]
MFLKEIICCHLLLVEAHLIQTEPERKTNISMFIRPTTTSGLECLKTLANETFRLNKERSLITLTTSAIDKETRDLENSVIRYFNEKGIASLELLGEPPHIEFESSTICFKESNESDVETCRKNFVVKESTEFYVIIAQDFSDLQKSLYSAYNSSSFNPLAEFLLYWRHIEDVSISDLVPILWKYQMLKVVLAEHDLRNDSVTVHVLQLKLFGPGMCLEKSRFFSAGPCNKSLLRSSRLRALLRSRMPRIFKNCTIETIAMQYEPFVISEDEGIEIKLLKHMEKYNNVTFDINLTTEAKDWGDKVNGSWEGNLGEIINTLKVGIGNVGPEADRLEDFDFTYSYKSPVLIWVVPIAENVKKWRVLTIIFTPQLWAVVFAVFFGTTGLFFSLSRFFRDDSFLRSLSGSFLASLQILISSSVNRTPSTNIVRLVFASGLLFALIVTCVYSSYLINVLTNVVREHQIQNEREILDSGLVIGGLEEYLERFQRSDNNDCLDEICKRYQYFRDENDTAMFWLKKVQDREACTPLTKLFVQYYMVKRFESYENEVESIYERKKRVKLFIIQKPINFYSLAIVMNKGNPFKKSFDKFIKKYVEAGLMYTLSVEYEDKFERLKQIVSNTDEGPERLGIYHVQGPFAVLGIGDGIAILIFLIEKLWNFEFSSVHRKISPDSRIIRRDIRNKSLFYDRKYGNMYGKNYTKNQKYLKNS